MTLEELIELGFDQSSMSDDDSDYLPRIHVKCSQCEALCINGVPTHEHGCPNTMHECLYCDTLISKGQRICESCANEECDDNDRTEDVDNQGR